MDLPSTDAALHARRGGGRRLMSGRDHVREVVVEEITGLLVEDGKPVPALDEETVLLSSGLDSLGFAVLVTRLEDALGYDPFTLEEAAVYPRTLGEFVDVYAAHAG